MDACSTSGSTSRTDPPRHHAVGTVSTACRSENPAERKRPATIRSSGLLSSTRDYAWNQAVLPPFIGLTRVGQVVNANKRFQGGYCRRSSDLHGKRRQLLQRVSRAVIAAVHRTFPISSWAGSQLVSRAVIAAVHRTAVSVSPSVRSSYTPVLRNLPRSRPFAFGSLVNGSRNTNRTKPLGLSVMYPAKRAPRGRPVG